MVANSILYLITLFLIALPSSCQLSQTKLPQGNDQQVIVDRKCENINTELLVKEHGSPSPVELIMAEDTLQVPIKHVQFSIINGTDSKIKVDNYYTIERFIDNAWKKCQRKYNTVIDDIAIEIAPKGTYSFTLNLSNIKDGYVEGTYRVSKTVKINNQTKQIYCVFYVK